jgi:hypothetical protein
MSASDSEWEWKDWAWIKAQWRDRRPFWISVALAVVSGIVPVVPIWISKGSGHRFYAGRVPLFFYDFMFFPTWSSPFLILAHIAAFGYLGPFLWRTVRRFYR